MVLLFSVKLTCNGRHLLLQWWMYFKNRSFRFMYIGWLTRNFQISITLPNIISREMECVKIPFPHQQGIFQFESSTCHLFHPAQFFGQSSTWALEKPAGNLRGDQHSFVSSCTTTYCCQHATAKHKKKGLAFPLLLSYCRVVPEGKGPCRALCSTLCSVLGNWYFCYAIWVGWIKMGKQQLLILQ